MMIWRAALTAYLAVLLTACGSLPADDGKQPAQGSSAEKSAGEFVPGEILVGIDLGGAVRSAASNNLSAVNSNPAASIPGARIVETLTFPPSSAVRAASSSGTSETAVQRIALPAGMSVETARSLLLQGEGVIYAEPNRIVRRAAMPDDPNFDKQWGLLNNGQTIYGNKGVLTGTTGVDIDAVPAWEIRNSSDVIVAILDSGIDLQHPDLIDNLWLNPTEIAGNGLDDDGNGYKDDLHGWNFVYNSAIPQDDDVDGHGTHTAGIVGAVSNNGVGVSSAGTARLMALKFLDSQGGGTLFNAAAGIRYAANNGARIINASYTYPQTCIQTSPDNTERLALDYARQKGVLVVTAAGNNGCNNDYTPFYPASHNLPNILSVAATDSLDRLASWSGVGSNYGLTSVHLGAPGHNIYSTIPRTLRGAESGGALGYGYLSGTSMAAPMVSSATALLWAHYPDWTYSQVRETLMATVDPLPALLTKTISGGRVNLFRALQGAVIAPPDSPTELQVTFAAGTASLNWRDNADNETSYIVERALEDGSFIELQRLASNSTSYNDIPTFDGGRLRYRVKATMGSLSSPYSNEVETFLYLLQPSQLVAVMPDTTGIMLTWQDNSYSEEFFAVERRTGEEMTFNEIATTGADATSYLDSSAKDPAPYHYRVRAGKSGGLYSNYSNEATVEYDAGSTSCFIATAAWGSPWGREVTSLRRFRDQVLLNSAPGRLFVAGYYRVSPPMARLLAKHENARAVVRWLLTPLVKFADWLAPTQAQSAAP